VSIAQELVVKLSNTTTMLFPPVTKTLSKCLRVLIMMYIMTMIGLPCGYHYAYEKKVFEDTKGVIRHQMTKTSMTKRKKRNNELRNTTQKSKDRATQTPLKTRGELMCFGRVSNSSSTSGTCRVTIVTNILWTEIQARNIFMLLL